jgi:type IV secretory pathway VirB4 component
VGRELDLGERLELFREFFRGEPAAFPFELKQQSKLGHHFKDWLCPNAMEFAKGHFRLDSRWGRVLYLQGYASYIKDTLISELCDLDRSLMLSMDILPVPTDEAVREIQNKLLGVMTNAANFQRRQNAANNFSAVLPYDMEQQKKETTEMLEDLTNRDQRMMFGLVTLVHLADTKEQLDSDTETLVSVARKHLCQLSTLTFQQKDGLDTVLPYGLRKIHALRTLTTESTAVLIPFRAQEILQGGGIYYGQNAVSKNMIVADRRKLLNGNSFRLGVSGSGKSFSAKEEIVSIALSTDDDILILDPESEFGFLTEALGGEVIRVSASSNTHINALDMDKAYGDERNPLIEKSEFILSLFEQLVGAGGVSAKEKSILDRCTYDVYREYMANNYQGEVPTLKDLYHSLLKQPEPEARGLALSSELFITGSLNTFAQPTNVDTKARIIAYDIRELGEQLMPIGMLVTLDAIFNRVIQNWKKGKTTWVFADEFYLLFRYQYSADFFYKLWKRIRKYNGLVTGLTQNVEELLRSDTARLMLANSEFLILLNQSATDRDELAGLLHISDTQLGYITNVSAGCGLIRCAGNIVPFENSFPRNTRLYQLMTTKPDEALRGV